MGQLMVSYRGLRPPAWILEGIAAGRISAVCLFAYNVESPAQLREATDELHRAAKRGGQLPPLVGIDQEGGQLMAVTGGTTELPGNMALGASRSEELAERAGRALGLELLALGCNLNFAPVLDLAGHLESAVVGTRAFSDDPALVAALGSALIGGLQSTGVLATAKHFPGHGDTALDSHHVAPVVSRSRAELERVELVPFRAAIAAGVAAVMSAHVRYTALAEQPATLSPAVFGSLLRVELGFDGLAISDAMDMRAVADAPAELRVRQAIEAGIDLVLLGHLPDQPELLVHLEPHFREESLNRIATARARLPQELPGLGGIGRHEGLAQEIADRAVTVIRGAKELPLRLHPDDQLGLVTVATGDLTPADSSAKVDLQLARQLRARHPRLEEVVLPYDAATADLGRAVERLRECRLIVVGTVNAVQDARQRELLRTLEAARSSHLHIVLRSPADSMLSPEHVPCLCTYGIRPANTEAAVKAMFGEISARGELPVSLPERRADALA